MTFMQIITMWYRDNCTKGKPFTTTTANNTSQASYALRKVNYDETGASFQQLPFWSIIAREFFIVVWIFSLVVLKIL